MKSKRDIGKYVVLSVIFAKYFGVSDRVSHQNFRPLGSVSGSVICLYKIVSSTV